MIPPTGRRVYAVRWRRQGARPDIRMRYFSRRHDAERYADKLERYGKDVSVFVTVASWTEVR